MDNITENWYKQNVYSYKYACPNKIIGDFAVNLQWVSPIYGTVAEWSIEICHLDHLLVEESNGKRYPKLSAHSVVVFAKNDESKNRVFDALDKGDGFTALLYDVDLLIGTGNEKDSMVKLLKDEAKKK